MEPERAQRALTALGSAIAAAEDAALRERGARRDAQGDRVRAALIADARAASAAHPRPAWPRLLAAACVIAIAPVAILLVRSAPWRPALEAVAGDARTPVRPGATLEAPAGADLPIRFSDGTRITLRAGARARVRAMDADGARVDLFSGVARADVVHRARSKWRFEAGPYDVEVVGTRFDVSWIAREERFGLSMIDGAVFASGPLLGEGRTLEAGERIVVHVREMRLELTAGDAARPVASTPPRRVDDEAIATRPEPAADVAPSEAARGRTSRAGVPDAATDADAPLAAQGIVATPPVAAALAAGGRYAEALRAAEELGFDALCARASARDVSALADWARLAGDVARAKHALASLRNRFPRSADASRAAFMLGRVALDLEHRPSHAATWFRSYLDEAPDGPFAREALGRLVEALDAAGEAAVARDAARTYLARHPTGPHAALARSLVGP